MIFLIVEDNGEMRGLLKSLLATPDDIISECSDGKAAFEAYRQCQPDWVTMDIELPSQDGLAATRQIVTAFPTARILIVTSHDSAALRESARAAGACGYVLKENLLDIPGVIGALAEGHQTRSPESERENLSVTVDQ